MKVSEIVEKYISAVARPSIEKIEPKSEQIPKKEVK